MTSETPSLLELLEAHAANAGVFGDLSTSDDNFQSVCADEGPKQLSVCADEEPSDVRLKADIEQVGTTVYGLPLYHFRYRTGTDRFQGVMAQDVLEVMPDAVVVGEDGYYRVKYAQLGIRMTRA
jgi:hypothetical protein